ncbi:MAG TPA: ABC transporter substrate-binding protein [Devosiaceae bacterium]|nr:ABC transporter substrate-binding protein [Devosiaceae bacterium]
MTLNRRDFLVQAGVAGAAATIGLELGGVGPAEAQEHVLSIALAARSPGGLNPQQTGLTGGDNWAICQLFDCLVNSADGTFGFTPADFRPEIAESFEASADAKTWTYHIRKGVKFHKGYGEVTADDVVFTFGRLIDPKIVTNGKAQYQNIDKVEAVDLLTVKFTLKLPDPLFNGACAATLPASILCRKAFEEKGAEKFKFDPIGTGPFQVNKVDPTSYVLLDANPDYFGDKAASRQLKIQYIADTTARTLAFLSGQIDMMEGARTPGWIPGIKQRAPKTIFDETKPGSFNHLLLNLTKKPFDDVRVRQAVRYAIDNAAIAKAYGELATPMVGMIASQFPGAVRAEDLPPELQYKPDVAKAKQLLAEAGYPSGVTVQCFTSQREDYSAIMLMIQEQLRAAGIVLDMKIIDHATFHNQTAKDLNPIALNSSSYPPVPTQPLLDQLSSRSEVKADGSGGTNYSHYGVAMKGVDDLLTQANGEPDFTKRIALVQQIEEQVLKDLPDMGIITLSYVIARNPRVDLGFPVKSGYAYWPLHKAKYV